MLNYAAVNRPVLNQVPPSARRVLDVGCGTGAFGAELKRRGAEVVGITYSEAEADLARPGLDRVMVADLNAFDFAGLGPFDCAVCSHVLEHLYDPAAVLGRVARTLGGGGRVVVALPNVLNWRQRLQFLRGRFRYTEGGPMDSTHFRFFDRRSAIALVEDAGLRVIAVVDDGYFPLRGVRGRFDRLAGGADRLATRWFPGLFAVQIIIVAERGPVDPT